MPPPSWEKAEKVGLSEQEIEENSRYVGIGAVKYADLLHLRRPGLQVRPGPDGLAERRHVRVPPVRVRPYPVDASARPATVRRWPTPELELAPAERALGLHLDQFGETLDEAADEYAPHKLAAYLFHLASLYTTFYDQCPVISRLPHRRSRRTASSCATSPPARSTRAWPCWASGRPSVSDP